MRMRSRNVLAATVAVALGLSAAACGGHQWLSLQQPAAAALLSRIIRRFDYPQAAPGHALPAISP